MSPAERQRLAARFDNPALCGITSLYVFSFPFQEHESNSNVAGLDARAARMRADRAGLLADVEAMHTVLKTGPDKTKDMAPRVSVELRFTDAVCFFLRKGPPRPILTRWIP